MGLAYGIKPTVLIEAIQKGIGTLTNYTSLKK